MEVGGNRNVIDISIGGRRLIDDDTHIQANQFVTSSLVGGQASRTYQANPQDVLLDDTRQRYQD